MNSRVPPVMVLFWLFPSVPWIKSWAFVHSSPFLFELEVPLKISLSAEDPSQLVWPVEAGVQLWLVHVVSVAWAREAAASVATAMIVFSSEFPRFPRVQAGGWVTVLNSFKKLMGRRMRFVDLGGGIPYYIAMRLFSGFNKKWILFDRRNKGLTNTLIRSNRIG